MNDYVPPHSEIAERQILASLLVDQSYANECKDLKPTEFYSTPHRNAFQHITDRIKNRIPVDLGMMAQADKKTADTLSAFLDDPGPATDFGAAVRLVKSDAVKRALIEQANAIIKRALGQDPAEQTVDYAYRKISSLCSTDSYDRGVSIHNVYTAERMVVEYEAYLRNLKNNRFITGIDEIDRRIRGVAGGEVLTILARAGSFKTAMLQNLLTRYVQNSTWGAVMFSIEMPVASVTERWFQILDGCTGKEVERQFTDKINADLKSASVEQFKKDLRRLYVIPSKVGLEDLVQYVRLIEAEHGVRIGVVGVDYMGLMDAPGENEYQQVSGVAKGIKGIAKRLNIPVLMLSQVSRKGGDGEVEISLDMGRGSGAVEEAADFVLGLWQAERPQVMCTTDERTEYDLVCRILKNRKGPKGSRWKLDIDAQTLRFGTSAVEYVVQKNSRKKKCG
jgi:replicative DNA helicase